MRTKAQQSEFIKRSISIYKGQVTRAAEEEARQKRDLSLNYDLNEFRLFLTQELGTAICEYCHSKLTVKSFVCDHREAISREGVFTLENIAVCCKSCNWQKGKMNAGEFILMRGLIYDNLPAEIAADFMEQRRVVKKRAAQLHILGSRGRVLTRFNCDFPNGTH